MTRGLYGWKPPSAAKDHLKDQEMRSAAERAAIARDRRMQKSRDWLVAYQAAGRHTQFNWSGILPVNIPTKETDDAEEIEAAYREPEQAAEVGHEEGVGDTAGEVGGVPGEDQPSGGVDSTGTEQADLRGQCADAAAESRWDIEGHTDFGDGDTPF